jgi:hypothetical protein
MDEGIAYKECRADESRESKIGEISSEACTLFTKWENGKTGALQYCPIEKNNTVLYEIYFKGCNSNFTEYSYENFGSQWKSYCSMVATGFIVYWIIHRKESATDVYNAYYFGLRQMFVEKENQKAGTYRRDLGYEFYQKHIDEEKERVMQSRSLFDYLSTQDKETILPYINYYFKWVELINRTEKPRQPIGFNLTNLNK